MSYRAYLKIRNFPLMEKHEYLRPTCIRLALVYEELENWLLRIRMGTPFAHKIYTGNKLSIWDKKSWEYLWDRIRFPFVELSDGFLLGKDGLQIPRYDSKDLKKLALDYFEKNPAAKQIEKGLSADEIDIKGIIKSEEEKYHLLLKKAERIVKKLKIEELTGAKLCELHHTYGIDPTIVEDILEKDLPQRLHDDYLTEYEKHKQTGKQGLKKEVIKAV